MPLDKNKTKAAFSKNVATEIKVGKPAKQAIASACFAGLRKEEDQEEGEEMKKPKKFIQGAMAKKGAKGALHRALGVPEGDKIPEAKVKAAASKPGKLGKEARFAEVLKGVRPGKKSK